MGWLEWSEAAFRRARAEDRCLVLVLTSFSSRWSGRLEAETFGDSEVQRLLEDYVAVRVDADRRPDVADRYAPGAVPTIAFLDPSGRLLYATGFLDAGEFRQLLAQLRLRYSANRAVLDEAIRGRDDLVRRALKGRYGPAGPPVGELFRRTVAGVLEMHDPVHGGFGGGARTPQPGSLRVLLAAGSAPAREALEKTLAAMTSRALWDGADGGFFTGTFDETWTKPSLEKSLAENAELVGVLAAAGSPFAKRTAEWIAATFWDEERGIFGSAQASDEEYFRLAASERTRRPRPAVDPTVLTDRAAKAASACLAVGDRIRAERTVQYLLNEHRRSDGSILRAPGGTDALLADRLALGHALLDLEDATRDPRYLAEAGRIADRLMPDFWSGEEQGLLDRLPGVDEFGELSRRESKPSQTGEGARLLARLAARTGEAGYRRGAERILTGLPDFTPDYGPFTAEIGLAARELEA